MFMKRCLHDSNLFKLGPPSRWQHLLCLFLPEINYCPEATRYLNSSYKLTVRVLLNNIYEELTFLFLSLLFLF